ncbi:Phospholipase D2 [Nosema granulosis]|uniref:phospholipase D n=1 Tax=Nosema granulosis TaxID=83296 RepID=A0A9P6GX69_9MICR|nr:Phospholipase D2 [Nosema granulosis]
MHEDDITKNTRLYKRIVEDCILIPFRRLGFFGSQQFIPILPRFISVEVDNEIEHLNSFSATLSYGNTKWKINRLFIKLSHLCKRLSKIGIEIEAYHSMKSIFSVQKDLLEKIILEIFCKFRNTENSEIFTFFNITRFSFVGGRRFEEHFYMCYSDYTVNPLCIGCCSHPKSLPQKIYVICKETHLLLYDYKDTNSIFKIVYYRGNFLYEVVQGPLYHDVRLLLCEQVIILSSVHRSNISLISTDIGLAMEKYKRSIVKAAFAPLRDGNIANFFVDSQDYYNDLYINLINAKKEIFISGWWVYPKLFLKRIKKGDSFDESYRLDNILKEKAKQGIRIYIIIYQEFYYSLSINSSYTYEVFSRLHRNIQILKYPNVDPTNLTYWSLHEKIVVVDQKISYIGGIDLCLGRFDDGKHKLFDTNKRKKSKEAVQCCEEGRCSLQYEGFNWPGLDYSNPTKKDFIDVQCPKRACIDRYRTPRLPWHDIQCGIVGPSAFDISLHFIQRWNFLAHSIDIIPDETYFETNIAMEKFYLTVQILRSSSYWSQNLPTENSIHEAYKKVINNAEKYIYIENQSFITNNDCLVDYPIQNTVGFSIIKRIEKADKFNESFKVYIVLPLLPAFEAANSFHESSVMNTLIELQSKTIYNGKCSLIDILREKGIDYTKYIVFLSLYKAQVYKKKLVGEQIYVHSKIMICDGTKMIVGSANINDRSMLGDRDSEICAYIEGKDVENLLTVLFKEHLCANELVRKASKGKSKLKKKLIGLFDSPIDLSKDDTFNLIEKIAHRNSKITSKLFKKMPNNKFTTFEAYDKIENKKTTKRISKKSLKLVSNLLGRFILYPFKFLCEENRNDSKISLYSFVPKSVYH